MTGTGQVELNVVDCAQWCTEKLYNNFGLTEIRYENKPQAWSVAELVEVVRRLLQRQTYNEYRSR